FNLSSSDEKEKTVPHVFSFSELVLKICFANAVYQVGEAFNLSSSDEKEKTVPYVFILVVKVICGHHR
ncbi:hypothetical protein ABQE22_03805, partial [Enterococcus durans]|uniref:hypothetical protein n=1 Tax=Enterococcus durans TaxID=53345 RepID=UPI0032E43B82